jgi:hypothetical protein
MQKKILVEFEEALNRLAGQLCWGISGGAGTGSAINLNIGRQIPRKTPLRNPHLNRLQRKYDSEYALFIHCPWRIDSKSKVVCGGWDENGEMLAGLTLLTGSKVTSVSVKKPAWDLDLTFKNGLVLRVFCDSVNMADMADNYSVFLPEEIFTVGVRSKLSKEPRGDY